MIKKITFILFLASVGSILTGFLTNLEYSQKLIGFGVVGLFLLVFPLFSYYRWKDKDIKDYMLTKENLDKMKESQEEDKH
ncbi:hypothetical protein [Seonamhaeicola marinus]|uniref:Isoleucyl-tRNA synthetase n=1 Tax=Seonamhaeicola marinus TaxID=1912246 RepID=A0A5D0HT28_9FLAO|nr:hypothetical protein [Seonamhaeicola marinus]TYA74476.1 hypothetical protein FUA24_14225 [Seonamhaeicola marinus]